MADFSQPPRFVEGRGLAINSCQVEGVQIGQVNTVARAAEAEVARREAGIGHPNGIAGRAANGDRVLIQNIGCAASIWIPNV